MKKPILLLILAVITAAGCKKTDPDGVNLLCFLTEQQDFQGKTTFTRDALNRLIKNTVFNSAGAELVRTELSYSDVGRLIRSNIFESNVLAEFFQYEYDGQGRITTERHFDDQNGDGTPEAVDYRVYTYNGNSNFATSKTIFNIQNIRQSSESYTYDNGNNVIKIERFIFSNNQPVANGSTDFTYDNKVNPFTAFHLPPSITDEFGVNNVTQEIQKNAAGQTTSTASFAYQYNVSDLPTQVIITRDQASPVTVTYAYDCQDN